MTAHPHDALFRLVFSEPENAAGLLQYLLPAPLVEELEWRSLQREPEGYIHDETLEPRFADVLFSIAWRDHPEDRLFALIEHLSTENEDTLVPFRMNDYQVHIGNKVSKKKGRNGSVRPPAVISVVVHHGEYPWRASAGYAENLDVPANKRRLLAGLVPDFRFTLDDLNQVTSKELRRRAMTAYGRMTFWFLKLGRSGDLLLSELEDWAEVQEELRQRRPGGEAHRALWRYYLQVSQVPVEKVRMAVADVWGRKAEEDVVTTAEMLEKKGEERGIKQGLKLGEAKGKAEGKAEGRAEGKAEAVLAVLGARDVPVSDEVRERILSCQDLDLLERWIRRATSAKSAADVVGE